MELTDSKTRCRHCGDSIRWTTANGVPAWAHDSTDLTVCFQSQRLAQPRGHGTGYQPTPLEDIDYWFDHLPLQDSMARTFVDVGCGEGVVLERWRLRSSEHYQHPLLVGIESDIDLAAYAAPHADMLLTGDAATFDYSSLPQPLLLWLFNPFGLEPMMQLIERLQGLDVWVVANNVQHVAAMQEAGYELRSYWWRGERENVWFWLSNGGTA